MNPTLSKLLVFALTFLGYAGLHALRQGWSFSKSQLIDNMPVSKTDLGLIDTLYLVSYSLGMGVLSNFIGKVSLKVYVVAGLILSAIFYSGFSLIYVSFGFFSVALMGVLMCLNGFVQATGWPGLMGLVGNWFEKDKKGLLMAIWAMNANAGNILASTVCNVLQGKGFSWTSNFLVTGAFAMFIALLIILFLQEKPKSTAKEQAEEKPIVNAIQEKQVYENQPASDKKFNYKQSLLSQESPQQQQLKKPKTISVFRALLLPRVPFYVIGYACLKGCIYGLLFWLPTYLDERNLHQQRGYIASMIDFGSLFGGVIVGILTDKFDRRAIFLSPLLFASSLVMFIVSYTDMKDAWMYYVAMFLIGTLIGGPYNIIGTVIAIDLGQQTGTSTNIVAVSSLIEGSAALFAAVSQVIISLISFDVIFYLFAGECIIASVVLAPLLYRQICAIRNKMPS